MADIEKTINRILFSETKKKISPCMRIRSTDSGQTEERNFGELAVRVKKKTKFVAFY